MSAAAPYRAYTPAPFTRDERDRVTVLFGGLHWRAERVLQAVFENLGYRARVLPTATREDLVAGKELADIGQCCPTSFTTGNLVNFLRTEAQPAGRPDRRAPGTLPERRARLLAALTTMQRHAKGLERSPRSVTLARWLDSWRGLGAIVDGMTAQGYDVELMQQPHGWLARFYLSSASHPVCAGSGWAVTPWAALQAAAWETLTVGNAEARLREQLATPQTEQRPDPRVGPAGVLRATRSPDPPAAAGTAGS